MKKALSWSELSLFLKDKDTYIRRYIDGLEEVPNDQMILGKLIHKAIEDPKYTWLKDIRDKSKAKYVRKILDKTIPNHIGEHEVGMSATLEDITLFSIFDGLDKKERILTDYKTGEGEKWSQHRTDYDKQMSFYAFVFYLTHHEYLKEIRIVSCDTLTGKVKIYKTVRSRKDLDEIARIIKNAVYLLKRENLWDKRLSWQERAKQSYPQLPLDTKN